MFSPHTLLHFRLKSRPALLPIEDRKTVGVPDVRTMTRNVVTITIAIRSTTIAGTISTAINVASVEAGVGR